MELQARSYRLSTVAQYRGVDQKILRNVRVSAAEEFAAPVEEPYGGLSYKISLAFCSCGELGLWKLT